MSYSETHLAQFPGREIPVLEWSCGGEPAPPLFLIAGGGCASQWSDFAVRFAGEYRVAALEAEQAGSLLEAIWAAGEPAVVIAQGGSGSAAIDMAVSAPGSLRALIIADYALAEPASGTVMRPVAPCLVFRGRQSEETSHSQGVRLHEAIPGSHLIEPENCGSWPSASFNSALEHSVRWFLSRAGTRVMEFEAPAG